MSLKCTSQRWIFLSLHTMVNSKPTDCRLVKLNVENMDTQKRFSLKFSIANIFDFQNIYSRACKVIELMSHVELSISLFRHTNVTFFNNLQAFSPKYFML